MSDGTRTTAACGREVAWSHHGAESCTNHSGGCATSGTTPASDTAQFGATYNYLPVNDMPRDDPCPVLSPEQQEKLRKELAAARDRQIPASAKAATDKPAAKPAAK
ncbi:hypothetical protein ACQR16_13145 [Bradyrhizobium oligotrophicum]|uniref:hypothetical protein n=1 Tax=Bradyrhizobium oligotrophicum TaxID=44255 RepID=UPI003EBEB3A2